MADKQTPSGVNHGRECTCCKATYLEPCDGKDAKCPNKLHLESKEKA